MNENEPRSAPSTGGDRKVRIQFLGDISLNGSYCDPQHHAAISENMAEVARQLGPCDLRIGNFESPLWGDGGVNELKYPRLNTTEGAAGCILPLGLDVALLATNHTYDCREAGFRNTVSFLEQNNIAWLGAGKTPAEAAKPLILERRGLKIGLLNYVGRETNPNLPEGAGVALNWLEEARASSEVGELRSEVDVVLVHLHWGEVELVRYPTVSQRSLARRLIESGASIVVGGHAHCLQCDEQWLHGHAFYCMGNFLFGETSVSPGQAGSAWPELARAVGVSECVVSCGGAESSRWHFFRGDGMRLLSDNTRKRKRAQNRISKVMAQSDRCLSLALR